MLAATSASPVCGEKARAQCTSAPTCARSRHEAKFTLPPDNELSEVLKFTMTLPRRKFLRVAVVVAALPVLPPIASALDYPTRTVRVIAPFWDGVFVPAVTPPEIVKLPGDEIRKIVALPDIASRIEALGFSPVAAPSDVFAKQLASESATWSEVIRAAGLKMR